MAKTTNFYVTQTLAFATGEILPADTTTKKTVYTAPTDGAVLKTLHCTSTDTAAMNVQLWVNDGSTDRLLGTIAIAANSGNTGAIASVDMLSGTLIPGLGYDQNGKRVLSLKGGAILKVAALVTVTAAKKLDFLGIAEEF